MINTYIDHTLLHAEATLAQIHKLCEEAIAYKFATVCINSSYVSAAAKILEKSDVKVCTVVGFPLGATSTKSKVEEAKQAIKDGASEIDMVLHQGQLKSKEFQYVENDIQAVKNCIGTHILKVILEICNLTDEEIAEACLIAEQAGADFVKTSTGFGSHGATLKAVQIMKENISSRVQIKASGGIRDSKTAQHYINIGVTRIGASSGIAIVEGTSSSTNY
ncbi:deoxyribose-phosphate aldolase DeoC [Psychroflexus torquis ATCC 700755]|jgi:deoxyribose-phosphate aldolase|uniref:Deoxyribose-phosphate aldolase n=1 Tax=Psychroflexus torquis (strain ATCC 700755 / CIP 106069 / ACAM 623) TaxID=313595 RepID=K4IXS3_PSYTT|nr:deoxyribose-phosphate aldolase [Psychroflexus torquis]AFU70280.1 deoxyribose-phosphate aldolase DeoC [Psychroflexus torquis ATCC 700755]